ncbi:hypothetical protein FBUS_05676 [Fasciolopsis buskii]|uniref:Ig-like domain-containing protein n=1 Tax=Fasciolopsis buskii TaxID=27845 RepID=A0A8E0VHE7_9TREM|nr:hypothetical protein FBUS_05676 [Fasciolopsis buski]
MRIKDSRRKFVAWLTFDSSLNITLSSRAIRDIQRIHLSGDKIVVALTHPLSGTFNGFNKQLIRLLKPTHIINILPNYLGTTNCWSCRVGLNDPTLRIQRLPLFDALCKAADCDIPKALSRPFFVFSSAPSRWIEGQDVFVSCVTEERMTTQSTIENELGICQTTRAAISKVNISNMDIQEVRRICHQRLSTIYSDSFLKSGEIFYSGVTAKLRLASEIRHKIILCYRRHGQLASKIFDPINGVTHQLSFSEGSITRVQLKTVSWLSTELKAATFECSVQGTGIHLVAELLVQRNSNSEDEFRRYEIVARRSLKTSVFGQIVPVNLTWLQVPESFIRRELICLVRPDSKTIRQERFMNSLPASTRRTRTSAPIRNLAVVPQCPSPPEINVKTHQSKLHLGSRFEASCVAATTADGLPLKLYYLTPKISIILCTKVHVKVDNTGLPVAISAPCEPVASDDKDCTSHQFVDQTYYPTHCEAVQHTEHKTVIRTIHFVITKLRPEDMDGRLFCQTINVYSVWSADEQFRVPRLHSRVHVLRFPMEPQIWSFRFDPEHQEWTCIVVAYPIQTVPNIKLLQATPIYLQTQLDVYSSSVNMIQPKILNIHLLPNVSELGSAAENGGSYYTTVKFYPTVFNEGGLHYGSAKLSCSFGGATKVLVTKIGKTEAPYESLVKKPSVVKAGEETEFICSNSHKGHNQVNQISLLRKVRHSWLNYDLAVTVLPLKSQRTQTWPSNKSPMSTKRLFGPWLYTSRESVRFLIGETDGEIGVDIGLLYSTEFDSGTYYCSNWSPKRIQFGSNPINKTIIGDKKQMSFGYRLLSSSPMFRFNEIKSVLVGHLLHLRCIAWSTNPSERKIELFYMVPRNRPVDSNRTVKFNPIQSAIVISQIDHYQKITEDSELHHIGCLMTDGKKERQIVLPGPKTECKAPEDLRWYPDDQMSHSRSSKIICSTDIGCPQPQFQWKWIAGPVPQITNLNDHTYRIVGSGPVLDLGKLPRSGTYVFRCTVTCFCKDEVQTQSIQASFYLHSDETVVDESVKALLEADHLDKNATLLSRSEDDKEKSEERRTETGRSDEHLDEMERFRRTVSQHYEKDEYLGRQLEQFARNKEEQLLYALNLQPTRQKETSDIASEVNPKFLPHSTEYLGYAIRRTPDFRSRIIRGCNRFMSTMGVRCPPNFNLNDELLNSDFIDKQHVVRWITLGLGHLHDNKNPLLRNQDNIQNMRLLDDLTNALNFRRKQHSKKLSEFHRMNVSLHEAPTRRLKQSLDRLGREVSQPEKRFAKDKLVEHGTKEENHPPKKRDNFHLEATKKSSKFDLIAKLVPLVYRQSLFERPRVKRLTWDNTYTIRGRERRAFMHIRKPDQRPPNTKLLDTLITLEKTPEKNGKKSTKREERTLLHLNDWSASPIGILMDRLRSETQETTKGDLVGKLSTKKEFDSTAEEDENSPLDFTGNRKRVGLYQIRRSERLLNLVDEVETGIRQWSSINPTNFEWVWLNFFRKISRHSRDGSLHKAQKAAHEEEEQMKDFFRVEPGLVKLPSATTAICPIPTTPKSGAYRLVKLRWLRLSHANSLRDGDLNEVEEIIQLGMDKREVKPLLFRFSSPNRVYTYPPRRWTDAFTLDITNLNVNDFGFYACTISFESTQSLSKLINVTKRARYPLCIIPTQPKPNFHLSRDPGGPVSQLEDVTECLSAEEEIFLTCEAEPFQIFCEKADKLTNGSLLLETKFYGHLFLIEDNHRVRRINLQSTEASARKPFIIMKRHFQIKHHTWILKLMPEHDGAYVSCEVLPRLVPPPYGMPDYWDWLAHKLQKYGTKRLRRISKQLKLCIEPLENPVRIYPEPESHYARPFRLLSLPPQQVVTCRAHQVPMVYPNISIYPIMDGGIEKALMHGLNQSQIWVDQDKMPIRWTAIKKPNEVRVLIPGNTSVLGIYYVICFAGLMNSSEEFILEVYPPATEFWVDLDISKAWLIIIIPTGFLAYVILRRRSHEQHPFIGGHSNLSADSIKHSV